MDPVSAALTVFLAFLCVGVIQVGVSWLCPYKPDPALTALWCRIIYARHTALPIYPSWRCRCDVCGREWIEDD